MAEKTIALILFYTSFRRHEAYLNIIKALAPHVSIGVLRLEMKSANKRILKTDEEFYQTCLRYGAQVISSDERVNTQILMIPRMGLKTLTRAKADLEKIAYRKLVELVEGSVAGVPELAWIVENLGKPAILVPDAERFALLEPTALEVVAEEKLEVVEIGTPFEDYPIQNDFKTDYVIAYPSFLGFRNVRDLSRFLVNVIRLLRQIPVDEQVLIKSHNASDRGGSESGFVKWHRLFAYRFWIDILDWFEKKRVLDFLPLSVVAQFAGIQNAYIIKKTRPFPEDLPRFGLQHYMKGIRKGLITGQTNLVWEALKMKIPVYNCSELTAANSPEDYQIPVRSYGTPCCYGKLTFDSRVFNKISDKVRKADLICYLRDQLQEISQAPSSIAMMEVQ